MRQRFSRGYERQHERYVYKLRVHYRYKSSLETLMTETPRPILFSLLVLTFVTGLVDAASVLGLQHVFTANMTGNVVFLGFALAGRGDVSVASSLNALVSFMVGALFGGRVSNTLSARAVRIALGVELFMLAIATLLGLSAFEWAATAIVSLLAFAMGLRNAVIRKLAIPDLTTTVLTLTVTGLSADSTLAGGKNPRWPRRILAILMMLAGACMSAWLLRFGIVWIVGAATAFEAIAAALLNRHADSFAPPAVRP
jgi:uncharacterized membrane protein YoaK (UPF0700 family)